MSVQVLIIEDEPLVAERLSRLVRAALLPEAAELEIATSLPKARQALGRLTVDLAFLDLNLVGADGFDLVRACLLEAKATIVVSANTDRAIEAFELGIADFVAKPFDQGRLELAISRASSARDVRQTPRYLAVEGRGMIEPVPMSSICRIQAAGNYAELVLSDGSVRLYERTMDHLESNPPARFLRIHRSHIVDFSLIASLLVQEGSRYDCELSDGTRLPVGRTRVAALRAALDKR